MKDGFGFIKRDKNSRRDHHDSRMFFHSSELLDKFAISGRRRIKMGDQVEFTGLGWKTVLPVLLLEALESIFKIRA